MIFDYSKLRGKIREVCGTQDKFAELIGLSKVSLSQRLNNQLEFTQEDMCRSCEILDIPVSEIPLYFFTLEVQKDEQKF